MTFYRPDADWFASVEVERVGRDWCIASTYEYNPADYAVAINDTSVFGTSSEWTTCLDYIPYPER